MLRAPNDLQYLQALSVNLDGKDCRDRLVKTQITCSSHTGQHFRELGNSFQCQHHQLYAHNQRREAKARSRSTLRRQMAEMRGSHPFLRSAALATTGSFDTFAAQIAKGWFRMDRPSLRRA